MSAKKNISESKQNISSQKIYYADASSIDENTNFAVIIRSPISKGTIREIIPPKMEENYELITAKNIPGKNEFVTNGVTMPILAYEKVSYKGEPIAILLGPDETLVKDYAKDVEVKYTVVSSAQDKPTSDEFIATRQIYYGESELLYSQAILQLKQTYRTQLQIAKSNEPLGAYCNYTKKSLKIYSPTRWPSQIIDTVCSALNIDEKSVHIIKTIPSDATTNSVYYTNLLAVQVAVASKISEKDIILVLSKKEMQDFIEKPVNVHTDYHVALEEGGVIRALNADIKIDCGVICPFAKEIVDHIVISLAGMYRFKNFCITCYACKTDSAPLSSDFQMSDFLAFFSMENLMQNISYQLHIEPDRVRLFNLSTKDKLYPININNQMCQLTLEKVLKNSDYQRKYISYLLSSKVHNSKFPLKGIGLSCAFEGNGFYGESVNDTNISIQVTMEENGEVKILAHQPSETILEIWKKNVSEILGTPTEKISVIEPFERGIKSTLPETVPENISILFSLLRKCCQQIKKSDARPITVKKDLASSKKRKWNQKDFCGEPFYDTSWIACVVEVAIDETTFSHNILSIWIVVNAGEIFNEKAAVASVKKSVYATLKMCMPHYNFKNVEINVEFLKDTTFSKEPKEIGNLVYNSLPAAITNAISVALQKDISVLPFETDTLYYSIKKDEEVKNEN